MSTDTVTPTETVAHDELISKTTTIETAAAAELASASENAEKLAASETTENREQTEGSSSNGVHVNGTTTNTETTEVPRDEQNNYYNDDQHESKSSPIDKNDLEPEAFRKVFIGGLSYKTDDQVFREYFSKFGEIADCIIMRDREGRSRGFGFVTYIASSMVDQLMAGRPHVLDGREIEPKRAVPREESGKPEAAMTTKKLFVGGIRENAINENDLHEYFSKYGNIIDTVIMKNNDGKCRGFGFVEFNDYDPVDKIILEKSHIIKGNSVNVEKALPKDQTNRARMAQSNYGAPGGNMRGPPPPRSSGNHAGGWGPMGNDSNYVGHGQGNNGYGSGGSSGGYGSAHDYGARSTPYGGGYGGDMNGGNGPRNSGGNMMGYGGSGPMNGSNYNPGGGSARGRYNDNFNAFGPSSDFNFGQSYGGSAGGGPMRRGIAGGRGTGMPYGRGRGGGGAPSFRGRS